MSDIGFKTEQAALDQVNSVVNPISRAANSFIFKREAKKTGLSWILTIAIKTKHTNSFSIISAIRDASLLNQINFMFSGSEANIQASDFETDYIFVVAEIRPTTNIQ